MGSRSRIRPVLVRRRATPEGPPEDRGTRRLAQVSDCRYCFLNAPRIVLGSMKDASLTIIEPAPPGTLSMRNVFSTWWPLAASWLMMGLELPAVSAVIARLADPEIHL